MRISVLGPLEVDAVHLRPRDRVILAALVVRRGSVVSGDELAQACWGDELPETWWQQVKTTVAHIRTALGPEAVTTESIGYSFGLDAGALDSELFERLVASGREHAVRGDYDRATDSFRRALALWRGPAFSELPDWLPARIESLRLAEIRTNAEEELLEARLELGERSSVIPDAERLVREQPLRESRWAILALADYRSQRQGEALSVLREARARLAESLGVEPGERLLRLETAILQQDPAIDDGREATPPDAECPYVGLRTFDAGTTDRFFGREDETATVVARARRGAVIAIVGPSGSGKSSLLLAGVVPALNAQGFRSEQLVLQPSAGSIAERLAAQWNTPDLVVIDQFEDLFRFEPVERERICAQLEMLLAAGALVAISLRSDYLDRATGLEGIGPAIGAGVFALGPLGPRGIREAIELPARLARLRLEPGLVEVVLRDAGDRLAALPHLSHALVETWVRREGSTLTVAGYEAAGGIAGAIATSAEERFRQLDAAEQQSCRSIMLRLLEHDVAGGVLRRRAPLAPMLGDPHRRRVVEQLVAARLLAIDEDTLVVAHEAVARAWPRLEEWLEDDAESAALLRRLESGAQAWDASGRAEEDLPRGSRFATLVDWRDSAHPDLTAIERQYLGAAEALHQDELATARRRAAQQRRQNRWLRAAFGVASGLLVIALVATGIAVVRQQDAVAANADATIEALTATARDLVDTDRDAASLLAAELYRRYPDDVRVRSTLLALLSEPGMPDTKVTFAPEDRIFAGAVPGSDLVVVASDDVAVSDEGDTLRLSIWDMSDGSLVRKLPTRLPDAKAAAPGSIHVDASGTTAVIVYPDVWPESSILARVDLRTGELLAGPRYVPVAMNTTAVFVDEGATLVFHPYGGPVPIWLDVATLEMEGNVSALDEDSGQELRGLAALDDGTVAIGATNRIDLYNPSSRDLVGTIALPEDLDSYDLQPAGAHRILGAGNEGIALIDATDGSVLWRVDPGAMGCNRLVVLADRGTFLCAGGAPAERSLADGSVTGRAFEPQAEWIYQTFTLGDGSLLVVNQRTTAFIQRFPVDDSGPISTLIAAGQQVAGPYADDRTIVTTPRARDNSWEPDDDVTLWDVIDDRQQGAPSDFIDALGNGIVVRWTADPTAQVLETVDGARSWAFTSDLIQTVPDVVPVAGSTSSRAYAISNEWITAFDPRTGLPVGQPLMFPGQALRDTWVMVHDAPGSDRVVVSWWDLDRNDMITGVFDISTGEELARGLYGDTASIMLPDGDVISTNSSEMRRSSSDLEPEVTLPKPVAGANLFELSADGSTLLLQAPREPASLYDVASGTRLGNDIPTDSPVWSSAHLAPDGLGMVTNTHGGVLLWDLDTRHMAHAACQLVGRELTTTEWTRYFGDEPQVSTCAAL